MRKFKTLISITLAMSCVIGLVGCKPNSGTKPANATYAWSDTSLTDSSQIANFSGDTMNVKVYYANSGYTWTAPDADNAVMNEITRITGVKLAQGTANDYDIKMGTPADGSSLTAGSMDLTTLLPYYAPNLYARYSAYNKLIFNQSNINVNKKLVGVPYGIQDTNLTEAYSDVSKLDAALFDEVNESYSYVWVRDDILKGVNSNAKTLAELKAIYSTNGRFTSDELFNASIDSEDAFYTFVRGVQEYINNNSIEDTYATYLRNGSDVAWDIYSLIISKLHGNLSTTDNMYVYWDGADYSFKNTYKVSTEGPYSDPSTWSKFETSLYKLGDLYCDGCIDKDCLDYYDEKGELVRPADTRAQFEAKVADGKYAILFSDDQPSSTQYNYRKVYLKINQDSTNYAKFVNGITPTNAVYLNKNLTAEKAQRILMWLDFQSTTIADKLYALGTAELRNADGSFKNADLNAYMTTDTANVAGYDNKVGLYNGIIDNATPVFSFFTKAASNYSPVLKVAKDVDTYLNYYFSSYVVVGAAKEYKVLRTADVAEWTTKLAEDDQYYIIKLVALYNSEQTESMYSVLNNVLIASNDPDIKVDGKQIRIDKYENFAATMNAMGASGVLNVYTTNFRNYNTDSLNKVYYWQMTEVK